MEGFFFNVPRAWCKDEIELILLLLLSFGGCVRVLRAYCRTSEARGSSEADEYEVELEFRGRVIVLVARVEVPR
jgi:hypothetical protein